MYDEAQGEGFIKDSVKLVVEVIDESLTITYAALGIEEMYHLTIEFLDRLAEHTGQKYNDVCEDLKEIEDGDT